MRMQATQEGLLPLKTWIKNALDQIIQVCLGEPELEFVWVGDDAIDPLQQAQTLQILARPGSRRAKRRGRNWASEGTKATAGLGKYNHNHDEQGRFATADDAAAAVGSATRSPRSRGTQVASNDTVRSDVSETDIAQTIEPPPVEPPIEPPGVPRPAEAPPPKTIADAVAPSGVLPGEAPRLGVPRSMPPLDDPNSTAQDFVLKAYGGRTPLSVDPLSDGGFVAKMSERSAITFRPARQASRKTPSTTASVDINDPMINQLNGGQPLKLKFPGK